MGYTERFICDYTWTTEIKDTNGNVTGTKEVTCDVEAKDAHNDLDIDAIVAKCEQISEQASELSRIDEIIKVYTESITEKDLCVDGMGVGKISGLCHEQVAENIEAIINDIDSVKERAVETFNQLQNKYNKIAKTQCAQKHDK